MWTHAAWPTHGAPARERLAAYATWCNAVEGNTTFYATPAAATAASWAGQTGPGFRFLPKLPRPVTHERQRADVGDQLRAFLAAIEPLGERVHSLWVQLPPSFGPSEAGALAGFLRHLPRTYRYSVEVRHRAFFTDPRSAQELEKTLSGAGAEWLTFDTTVLFADPPGSDAEREAWAKKPRLPRRPMALTDHPVVRYLGRDDPAETVAGWRPWLGVVAGWLREGRTPTVFIHTPDNAAALDLARRFHADVRALVPGVEPLPDPLPVGPPTLFLRVSTVMPALDCRRNRCFVWETVFVCYAVTAIDCKTGMATLDHTKTIQHRGGELIPIRDCSVSIVRGDPPQTHKIFT